MADSSTQISKGVERLARWGYAAKGVLYVVIGLYVGMAVLGMGGDTAGVRQAILEVAGQPYGWFMLILLGVGLAGHVLWRMVQAFGDPERKGRGLKGVVRRIGMFISGAVYLMLAFYTLRLILGSAGGGSSTAQRSAEVMSFPGGIFLLGAVGIGFTGVGLYQMWRAYQETYRKHWKSAGLSRAQVMLARTVARVGLPARAVLFVVVGFYLVAAAWKTSPGAARDTEGAMRALSALPFGQWLLAAIAIGMVCYGCYCFCNAWLKVIKPDNA